jgi:hypothetical protein
LRNYSNHKSKTEEEKGGKENEMPKKKINQPTKQKHTHKRREEGRDDWHPPQQLMQDCEREKPQLLSDTHTSHSVSHSLDLPHGERGGLQFLFLLLNCLNSLSLSPHPYLFSLHLR